MTAPKLSLDSRARLHKTYRGPFMAKTPRRHRRVGRVRRIPVARRIDMTRAEFNRLIAQLNERSEIINDLRHNPDVQFQRLAQLQAELDLLRRAFEKPRAS